jgi:hypothetical protein
MLKLESKAGNRSYSRNWKRKQEVRCSFRNWKWDVVVQLDVEMGCEVEAGSRTTENRNVGLAGRGSMLKWEFKLGNRSWKWRQKVEAGSRSRK